ncbi:MAG TPA: hypothetical protein VGQ83_14845 [Polyangia bacterium]
MPEDPRPAPPAAGDQPARPARSLRFPIGVAVATTVLILGLSVLGPRLNLLPWGCYRFQYRPMFGVAFVALVFTSLPWVFRWVRSPGAAAWKKLLVLVPLGACLQWAVILAEARGARPMTEKLFDTGHVEFLRVGLQPLPEHLVRRYEELIPERKWVFPRSKPPGSLVFYRAVVVVAETRVGAALQRLFYGTTDRLDLLSQVRQRLSSVLFILLPLLTFLTVVPLFLLARNLLGARAAEVAALLYLTAPMVLIVVMHLDGGLYPLLGTTALWLAHEGARRRRLWLGALGGAVLSLGLFTTFGLLPLVPLAVVLVLGAALADTAAPLPARLRRAALDAGLFAAGLLAVHVVFVVALGYRPLARVAGAQAFHASFKGDIPLAPWLWGNMIQFALWLGLPLAFAALAAVVAAARRGAWRSAAGALCLGLGVFIAITDFIGHAKSEVMRLWLFWVPFLCLAAAGRLVVWEEEGRKPVVAAALLLQLVYVFAFRALYDCY